MDEHSTRETSLVHSATRILREFLVEPFLMVGAIGGRYQNLKKHEIAVASLRAGIALGRQLERSEHDAKHTCRPLSEV